MSLRRREVLLGGGALDDATVEKLIANQSVQAVYPIAYARFPIHLHAELLGSIELGEAVVAACEKTSNFEYLYPLEMPIKQKIETIAQKVYGADGVDYTPLAARQIDNYERNGFGDLPVCIAKTHLSISSDPTLRGAPTGWTLPVREVRASVGAGFVYPICGAMSTMPGLGASPALQRIDIDADGNIVWTQAQTGDQIALASDGSLFVGNGETAVLHALRHHVGDEAFVVGVGGIDRHLRGGHLHTPLF